MSNQMILNSTRDNDNKLITDNDNNKKITEDDYKKSIENEYEDVSDIESHSSNFSINEDKYSNRSPSVSESSVKMSENNMNQNNQNIDSIKNNQSTTASLSSSSNSLNNGIIRTPHLCNDCLRTFKDINNYKEHRFQEHHEKYPNVRQCSMCSYATLLKSKYDCHMRCHLNNKVIRCQRCNYSTINIRHMSKHERMHMITTQAITTSAIPNLLNEKLLQINPLKRKGDQPNNEIKFNKYQKTSISSSLSPSSVSSTSSANEANNNNHNKNNKIDNLLTKSTDTLSQISNSNPNNSNILQLILNTNRLVSDDCKENHYNNTSNNSNNTNTTPNVNHNEYYQIQNSIQQQQQIQNETKINNQQMNLAAQPVFNTNPALLSQYTLPLATYFNKTNLNYPIPTLSYQSNIISNVSNDANTIKLNTTVATTKELSSNETPDALLFPKNKYEKFISNFNNQKQKNSIDAKDNVGDNHEINKKSEIMNEKNEIIKQSKDLIGGNGGGVDYETNQSLVKINNINQNIDENKIIKMIEENKKIKIKRLTSEAILLKKKNFRFNKTLNQFQCNLCSYKTKQKNNIYNHSKCHNNRDSDGKRNMFDTQRHSNNPNLVKNDERINNDIKKQLSPATNITQKPTISQDLYNNLVDLQNEKINNLKDINTTTTSSIQQQQHQQQNCFNPNLVPNQQSPTSFNNLFNTLRFPYPLSPTYLSLLALHQQQQPKQLNNNIDLAYQNSHYEIQKQQQQQQQQHQSFLNHSVLMQQLLQQPQSTITHPVISNNSHQNSFSIENLFALNEPSKKPTEHHNTYETLTSTISKHPTVNPTNETKNPMKCCDHKEELYLLRQNVYKMLYKNLPNVLLAFNLLNDPLSPQIDYILQSLLVYNQDNETTNNLKKENPFEIKQFFNPYMTTKQIFPTTTTTS